MPQLWCMAISAQAALTEHVWLAQTSVATSAFAVSPMVWSIPSGTDSACSERSGDNGIAEHSDTWAVQSPAGDRDVTPTAAFSAALTPPACCAEADSGNTDTEDQEGCPSDTGESPPKKTRFDNHPLPSLRRLHPPVFTRGTAWWAAPLWQSLAGHIAKMPGQPARPMRLESFCAGTCAEAFGLKAENILKERERGGRRESET